LQISAETSAGRGVDQGEEKMFSLLQRAILNFFAPRYSPWLLIVFTSGGKKAGQVRMPFV
jgi:hypothetical protein